MKKTIAAKRSTVKPTTIPMISGILANVLSCFEMSLVKKKKKTGRSQQKLRISPQEILDGNQRTAQNQKKENSVACRKRGKRIGVMRSDREAHPKNEGSENTLIEYLRHIKVTYEDHGKHQPLRMKKTFENIQGTGKGLSGDNF